MEAQPSEHMILCNISYQNKQVLSYPKDWKGSSISEGVFFNLNRRKLETQFATL